MSWPSMASSVVSTLPLASTRTVYSVGLVTDTFAGPASASASVSAVKNCLAARSAFLSGSLEAAASAAESAAFCISARTEEARV